MLCDLLIGFSGSDSVRSYGLLVYCASYSFVVVVLVIVIVVV